MRFSDDISAALLELETELGSETFTWKNAEITCVPNTVTAGTVLIIGGHERVVRFSLNVRRSHFLTFDSTLVTMDSELYTMDNNTPHPVAGRRLTFRGKVYQILTAGEDSSRTFYTLTLGDEHSAR